MDQVLTGTESYHPDLKQKQIAAYLFHVANNCRSAGLDPDDVILDDPSDKRIRRDSICERCSQYYVRGGPCVNRQSSSYLAHCLDPEMIGYKSNHGTIFWKRSEDKSRHNKRD